MFDAILMAIETYSLCHHLLYIRNRNVHDLDLNTEAWFNVHDLDLNTEAWLNVK